jgi:UDP-N-acetylmuramate: L-alanyl-gamma-D-glutamyl-meso-diaminopimelate ligase
VKRRQDLVGHVGGVRVYDDFAHHPTAVDETLRALRSRHPEGRLWAIFEPRSATACRALHQEAYARAFDVATFVVLAPLGRAQIASSEALDLPRLVRDIGPRARLAANGDAIVDAVAREAASGDTVAVLSNGAFGGVPHRIVAALAERAREGGAP